MDQKKETPTGFKQLDDALRRKLDGMGLSLLDVLADTMQWIGWGKHFGPLVGSQRSMQSELLNCMSRLQPALTGQSWQKSLV